ncbi:nucleolar protein 4 [Halyomorpha halys]|uniref:nucleolar protein 4 n=1 Tax=Halyomorpha halys TaxID=286706 RepID=UPI0006D4E943|nr:nucleolar protein 4 [Halyomorpha halys]
MSSKSKPKEMRISPDLDNEEYSSGKNGEVKEEREDWCYTISKKPGTPQSRELSSPLHENGSTHDETSSSGNKDDDDDLEDDSDDLKSIPHDPERLKAFNMFVRLFVDENLDRIVPISKQPKEKIQAIIDSCNRQFPEFGERARKRIRTYLKSCRRNKRSRDGSFEAARPTPAHLTSAQAEQILASACENEAHNAKRMRLGLEPVGQPMPLLPGADQRPVHSEHFSPANLCAETKSFPSVNTAAKDPHTPRQPELRGINATGISTLYRTMPEGPGRPVEPTDLSLRPRLSMHEINSVRRLVSGYRESAAFLLRSADELEQLLLHQ